MQRISSNSVPTRSDLGHEQVYPGADVALIDGQGAVIGQCPCETLADS